MQVISTGETIAVSRWIEADQALIGGFAALTGDDEFIHTDLERTQADTDLGGTIAHGFLTLRSSGRWRATRSSPARGWA